MTSSAEPAGSAAGEEPPATVYADRVYRSVPAVVCGVVLLAIAVLMLIDALINSELRIAMTVLAGVVAVAPLIAAFTLRPVVRAGKQRLLVRNPFRTIALPWAAIEDFHAGYSCEVRTQGGKKYQLWSIPVSLRARRKAATRQRKAAVADLTDRTPVAVRPGRPGQDPNRSWADNALDELRDLREANAGRDDAQGSPAVSWAWPVYLPFVIGVIALIVLNTTG